MDYVWAALFLGLLGAVLFLHLFSLPANWLVLALAAVWKWLHPAAPDGLTWLFLALLLGIALAGEGAEFAAQVWGAKKYGASGRGNLGGIIGAIAGAVLGAPFLFGLGALLGSLAGAFIGCLILELTHRRPLAEARQAAWGAFWGKAFGATVKLSLGAVMVILCAPRVWP
jgi:uncharacterized protein YqgC (DUF456 family)